MAEQLSAEQIAEFKEAFDMFDTDKSGFLSIEEIGDALRRLNQNPTTEDLKKMLNEVDADGSGEIGFDEFIVLLTNLTGSEDQLRECFRGFDTDGNGYITKCELKSAMAQFGNQMSDSEIDELFRSVDDDDDGQIDFKEFCQLMNGNN